MSVKEYKYQKATHEQLDKCKRWCQNQLEMRDWEIHLDVGNIRPDYAPVPDDPKDVVYGSCSIRVARHKGEVWIAIDSIKDENENPYSTLIHEMLHFFLRHELGEDEDNHEDPIYIMEPALYRLFCYENKIKIASLK